MLFARQSFTSRTRKHLRGKKRTDNEPRQYRGNPRDDSQYRKLQSIEKAA